MTPAALFDLDGTLCDTPAAIAATLHEVLVSLGGPMPSVEALRQTVGRPLPQVFATLLRTSEADPAVAKAIARYQACFADTVLPRAEALVYSGVRAGLARLRAAGLRTGVATSKIHRSAVGLLRAAGLLPLFDAIVGADQVRQPKPHPETGLLALKLLGVEASACTMVGDTLHDVGMAKDAGMRVVAVSYGVQSAEALRQGAPDALVHTFEAATAYILGEAR